MLLRIYPLVKEGPTGVRLAGRILELFRGCDDLTHAELTVLNQLLSLATHGGDERFANSLFELPLFDVSEGDFDMLQAAAVGSLGSLVRQNRLDTLLEQPWFKDGLTDEELALIAVLIDGI